MCTNMKPSILEVFNFLINVPFLSDVPEKSQLYILIYKPNVTDY